jgi:cystathionine beta-lyase
VDAATLHHVLLTEGRVWLDTGTKYGAEGHGYLRVNLGCPRSTVDEAVRRIVAGLAGCTPRSRPSATSPGPAPVR